MTGESALAERVAAVEATPARHVHLVLMHARRRGWGFEEAWTTAKKSMPRGSAGDDAEHDGGPTSSEQMREWSTLLDATRDVWRAAYHRTVPPAALTAAGGTLSEALDLATDA